MKNSYYYKFIFIIFLLILSPLVGKESGKVNTKSGGLKRTIKEDKKLQLTVQRVVEYLLRNNLDVKQALLEYRGASSPLKSYKSKYDIHASGGVLYSVEDNPNASSTFFSGESTKSTTYSLGLSKSFNTGTSLTASITALNQNVEGAGQISGSDLGGRGYKTAFKVEIAQEILKNAFGIADRLTETQLKNSESVNKKAVRLKLATLLVDALIGFWDIAVAEENLKTTKVNLSSTKNIRNLIARKMRLGLAEREDILDWNGKVLGSQNNLDQAAKFLFDARLAILRTLNLEKTTEFVLGKTFKENAPEIKLDQAMQDAFVKRIDWNNLKIIVRNSQLEYRIASNQELPSVKLKAGVGTSDYDTDSYANTVNDYNRDYSVGFEVSHPLGNTEAETRMRDARLNMQRQMLELEKTRQNIRDEIISLVKQCDVDYKVFTQTRKSREYAQNYYYQVFQKFKRGRYSAVQLKLALDSYIMARQKELQSLVNYNVSLLRRDLARNVVFDNLGIDIDGILKRVEN